MSLRYFAVVLTLLVLAGCATPPREELYSARRTVSLAQAMGGESVSPEYFTLARERLLEAEGLMESGDYDRALQVLQLSEYYAGQVIILVYERDDEHAEPTGPDAAEAVPDDEVAPSALATEREKVVRPPKTSHVVRPGESLWTIAAQRLVYGDALQWPLIYKANRDQIKDPRQIYPKQELTIPRDVTAEEIEAAREMARSSEVFPIPAQVRRPVSR